MAAYSSDLRERVFEAYQSGLSSPQVAERFGVSAPFVRKLALLQRRYGSIERRPCTQGRKPILNDKQRDQLIELAGREPDLTLAEMKGRLRLRCCETTVWRELKKAGFSFKRSLFQASEQLREDVQEERERWARRVKRIDARRLIFLDESGVRVGMKRLYGRSAKGWRVVDHASGGHWQTHTMTAAIGVGGVVAAMVTRRAINSITFRGFIEEFLAPKLNRGDVVVMDNLAVHKVKGVEEALHRVGARARFLPPYSPDFNPIEQAWSQAKSWLRKKSPPTFDTLVESIGDALRRVTPEHYRNYFINSGYRVT